MTSFTHTSLSLYNVDGLADVVILTDLNLNTVCFEFYGTSTESRACFCVYEKYVIYK